MQFFSVDFQLEVSIPYEKTSELGTYNEDKGPQVISKFWLTLSFHLYIYSLSFQETFTYN